MHNGPTHQLPLHFDVEHSAVRERHSPVRERHLPERERHWPVRVSHRARRLSVRVFHDGRVEIVVPPRASARTVEQFVARHRPWIERKRLATFDDRPAEDFPPPIIRLDACEERWQVALDPDSQRLRIDAENAGLLRLRGRAASADAVQRLLREFVVARAREVLPGMLEASARELGARYTRLVVRCQRTRWGSCSRRGTISLNACAMFQRPAVLRYLMVHELAHLTHMNHSKRFWRLVEQHAPDFRALDRELRAGWRRVPRWFDAGVVSS